MSCPLTPRRFQPQQQRVSSDRLKRRAYHCQPMEGEYSPADSFQTKELGAEPITVQGFEGWTPEGLDSHLRTNRVRDDYGRAHT